MTQDLPIITKHDPLPDLVDFLHSQGRDRLTLVADDNTYAALGRRVADMLAGQGFDLRTILLRGEEIIPDERFIMQVLVPAGNEKRTYLAVGSGVVTDIVRFASHRSRTDFISLPTAPSVDGYTSHSASLVIERLKVTIAAQTPVAIFADLDTLCAAPRPMIAAGFGDVLAKYTAHADWGLAHLFWGVPFDEAIARRAAVARDACVAQVEEVGRASPEGIRSLMDALSETGICMLEFGASYPAAGSEHYISHLWEMKLLREKRPALLHGAKVGLATIYVAREYERVRGISQDQAAFLLARSRLPDREQELARIRAAFGDISEVVIAEHAPFLDLTEADYEALKAQIIDHWPEVQDLAAAVPTAQQLAQWLQTAGGQIDHAGLGLSEEETQWALESSPYFRNRFTVYKLKRMLGLQD